MNFNHRLLLAAMAAGNLFWICAASASRAGVSYLDPAGGWRYSYQGNFNPPISGNPPGFGTNDDFMALDGTWQHNQSDRWDGHVPGDPISNPTDPPGAPETVGGGPNGWSPGGAGSFTEGGTNYIRVQDTGNPELHGWLQGSGRQDTNRRVYFGHDMGQDGPLASQRVLDNGITLSFRVKIPDSGPLDSIYTEDGSGPVVRPWFDPVEAPNGRGAPMTNSRGNINIMQNDPDNFNLDSLIGFSLVTSTDIDQFAAAGGSGTLVSGSGSGGLIMNNLNGGAPSPAIDSESGGVLNIVEISDEQLNEWHEFWITMQAGGVGGTHAVKVYMDGSTTSTNFNVTSASNGNAAYAALSSAFLEFGFSDTAGWGSFDIDFISYKLGVITPVAAPVADADFDNDGDVDGSDFLTWQRGLGVNAGATHAQGDADGNAAVNAADLAIWKTQFGVASVAVTSSIPEPATLALAASAMVFAAAVGRRRRR